MADWNIRPRATACCTCGTPFAIGDKGHSILLLEGEQWMRQDFCPTCFKAQKERFINNQTNAWTFVVPPQQKSKTTTEDVVKRETAEHLLRALIQRQQDRDIGMIYILSILLERNKQLIERRTTFDDAGRRVRMYEHRATGDVFAILDPGLQPVDVPPLQKRIVALLEGTESLTDEAPTEGMDDLPAVVEPPVVEPLAEETWPVREAENDASTAYVATDAPMPRDMSLERMHEDVLPMITPDVQKE